MAGEVGEEYNHLLQMRSMITPLRRSPLHLRGSLCHSLINQKGSGEKKGMLLIFEDAAAG